jgi:hypothetical protein
MNLIISRGQRSRSMRKQLLRVAVVASAFALIVAATAFARLDTARVGNLFIRGSGGISPAKLPRHRQVPISAHLHDQIGTVDGSHPPALSSVVADIDKTIRLDARGLPVCRYGQLTNRPTAAARQACPDAIVGSGEGEVEVAFPDQNPFTGKGKLVLFNGGVHGGRTLHLIHAYVSIPAPTAIVVKVKLTRIHRGAFGMHVVARVPTLAAGDGSPTRFRLQINRKYPYKGRKKSYLTASCPTGHYFADAKVAFTDGPMLHITHVLPCTPMR